MPTNLSITLKNACLLENETNAVWVKEDSNFGIGHYFWGQHELLLVGEKGEMPVPETFKRISSVSLYLYAMKHKQVKCQMTTLIAMTLLLIGVILII